MRIMLVFLILFLSCVSNQNNDSKDWKIINSNGLMKANESFEKIIFINDDVGFLFGTNYTDDIIINKRLDEQNAVIYKSIDKGFNWNATFLGKGQFVDACYTGDTVFALKNRFKKDYVVVDSSVLFASYDRGNTWSAIARFNYHLRSINFITTTVGIAIANEKFNGTSQRKILKTFDGGKTWDEVPIKESVLSNIIDDDYNVWILSANARGAKNSLIKRNLKTNGIIELDDLPLDFNPLQIGRSKNSTTLWLLGKEKEQIVLYGREKDGRYIKVKTIKDPEGFPVSLYINEAYMAFFIGKKNSFSVSYRLFLSQNHGTSWRDELPIVQTYIKPFTFSNDKIWAYAGTGNIQVRN